MNPMIHSLSEETQKAIQTASFGLRYTPKVNLYPEHLAFNYNPNTANDVIRQKLLNGEIVAAKITACSPNESCYIVQLNRSISAKLPFSESSVQTHFPILKSNIIAPYGRCLMDMVVGVQLLYTKQDCLYVTRIPNLEANLKKIKQMYADTKSIYLCSVVNVSNKSLFVDMGGGIMGHIGISNASRTKCFCLTNWFRKNDVFFALQSSSASTLQDDSSFELSRKDLYYQLADYDLVQFNVPLLVKIGERTAYNPGYYVEITPGINGTIDTSEELNEGQCVTAYLRKKRQHPQKKGAGTNFQPILFHLTRYPITK